MKKSAYLLMPLFFACLVYRGVKAFIHFADAGGAGPFESWFYGALPVLIGVFGFFFFLQCFIRSSRYCPECQFLINKCP